MKITITLDLAQSGQSCDIQVSSEQKMVQEKRLKKSQLKADNLFDYEYLMREETGLSYNEKGSLIYTPYIFPDEEVHISECTFMYGSEKEKIYDCTELLKRSSEVPEDMKEIMEEAWEGWVDE